MEGLVDKLNTIPNFYFDFGVGISAYAKKKPERLKKVLDFKDNSDSLTPSDVVKFVMLQPDFHEHGLSFDEKVS